MKNSAVFRRILICMLALTMLSCVVSANVTGMVWAESETDAPATDAPATDAPATEAPATDAPATEAPATDAPIMAVAEEEEDTLLLNGKVYVSGETYKVTTIRELVEADTAVLRWESKGSADNSNISAEFGGETYVGFDDVYEQIYLRLLKYATITVNNNGNIWDAATAYSNEYVIVKIAANAELNQTITIGSSTSGTKANVIIVSECSATIKLTNKNGRFITQGNAYAKIIIQGRDKNNIITVDGQSSTVGSRTDYPFVRINRGSLYATYAAFQNFKYSKAGDDSDNSVVYIPNVAGNKYIYISHFEMCDVVGGSSPGFLFRAYYASGSTPNSTLYFYDCIFQKCKTTDTTSNSSAGGPVIRTYAADNSQLRMESCKFLNNRNEHDGSNSGGGAILWKSASGRATLVNCEFKGNYSATSGGAIYNVGNMDIYGCTFGGELDGEGNTANQHGGAIVVQPPNTDDNYPSIDTTNLSGSLSLDENTKIIGNTSGENGGAIYFYPYEAKIGTVEIGSFTMQLEIDGSEIRNNSAGANGGAIAINLNYGSREYITGVTIKSGEIENNTAANNGGAIWMSSNENCTCYVDPVLGAPSVTMQNGTLDGNGASRGGAIYIETGSATATMNFNMSGGVVTNNIAASEGGAVYISGGNFNMTGGSLGEFDGANEATYGGGVYLTGGSFTLNGEDAYISYNSAQLGGGVYLTKINPTLLKGNITNNIATSSGGGIFIDKKEVVLNPTGIVLFEGNQATDGAGMYINGTINDLAGFSIDNSATGSVKFSENVATGNGGGVCLSYGDMTITNEQILLFGNEAKNGGGAAVLNGSFTLSGGSIGNSGEVANKAENGGGIYVEGGNVTVSGTGTITNNTAESGGGVYLTGGSFTLNGENAYISSNTAEYGGGVYLTEINPTLLVGNITNNIAENGGGIFIDKKEVVLAPTGKVLFEENRATDGAGMYINGTDDAKAGFSVAECNGRVEFSRNVATGSGGGVCLSNGKFTINYDNIDIINNTAKNGGGVAVLSGEFDMNAGGIGESENPNRATNGGGVYVAGTVTINNGTVEYNTAENGGGIYVAGTAIINSGTVEYNTAANGGGVYVAGTANISGTVEYNTATKGGGAFVSDGNLTLGNGGLFFSNTAVNGGGAYVSDGNLILNAGGSFLANSAVPQDGENANGGGFFVEKGNFRMNDGTVAQNTADSGFGGGGYVDGGNFIMAKGTLGGDTEDQANTAIDGGGIYVSDGNVSIYNGTIKNNRATRDGGAIFVSSNDTEVNVIILSGYLLNNIAGECGGGVAIRSKSSHSITVEVGCLMYHGESAFEYDGDYYGDYRNDGAGKHEFCPQVAGNNAGINGGGFFLDSSSSSLYYYCIEENPENPNIANGNTNSYSLDVEGGKVVFGDYGYHTGVVDQVRGNVKLYSTILVNAGKVDVYGDMDNPYFDSKITVDITDAGDYFKDHRRIEDENIVYKIHYFENFEGAGEQTVGKYIANQYSVVDGACYVEITGSAFERTGYKIEGWYAYASDGTAVEYKVGTTYNLVELTERDGMGVEEDGCESCTDDDYHLMLYARWAKKGYVIEFDSNKPVGAICTGEMDKFPCTQGDPFELPENQFRCEGYRFKGWALTSYDTEIKYPDKAKINEDLTKEDSKSITLYAVWEICDHVGHLVYTVENGDTIVESCQACDGHVAYAVLSAANVIYDGEPHPATISGDFGTPVWLSKTFKLTYQKTYDPKWDTKDLDGVGAIWKDPTEAVPVHAGEYIVTFTVDNETTVSCVYTIERVKWDTPPQPEFVSRAEEVDGQSPKMGIGIIKPVASTPSSLPQYEYGVQYKQADGTLTMLEWVNEEFIYTELSNTYYYISARAREDRNHIESDSSTVVTYLSDTAKVIFVYGDGIKITEANSDGDTKFTFIAEPKDGFHKRNWSVSFHENSQDGPPVDFTENDGKYEMIAAKTGITYYIIISGVAPDAVFETKATQDQVFTDFSNVATLRISRDSAFTVRYTLKNFIPADYGTLNLKFSTSTPSSTSIPAGTKIIMVKDGTYWYCVTNAAKSEVALDEFYKMGETVSESTRFVPDSGDTPISSTYQFIFDFSETAYPQTEDLCVSLTDDDKMNGEMSKKVDLSAPATFKLECSGFNDNKATIKYTYTPSAGHASIWNNREAAIVITLDGELPADLNVMVRSDGKEIGYSAIGGKKFIIPLGALVNGEGTIEVELNSNLISVSADAKVDIQWMVSDTLADKAPGNGKEVAKVSFDWISLMSKQLPVVKIQGITSPNNATVSELRLCNLQDSYAVIINTRNIPADWTLTMYLYRKDTTVGSNSYGRFIYTGYYETLQVSDSVRSDFSLKAQEKGTFYLYVVATTGEGENRIIMSEDKYFFIAEE